jgi:hypothetical protein
MFNKIFYEKNTGKIEGYGFGDDCFFESGLESIIIDSANDFSEESYFIQEGKVKLRPKVNYQVSNNLVVFSLVPKGSQVFVNDEETLTTEKEEELTLEFPFSGIWKVKIEPPFPWVAFEKELEV